MSNCILKLTVWLLPGIALMFSGATAYAQQSCAIDTTNINAQISVTKQSFVIQPDGYVTNYYTGWNGNCWVPSQDAFVLAPLGDGPFTYSVTIFDTQNNGFRFTDVMGAGCGNAKTPAPVDAVVFGAIGEGGRVGALSPWPIPNLPPSEKGEYYGFTMSQDSKSLTFVDRDNIGPDYHFGVYLCDPAANTKSRVQVFLSDPGQQPKGTTNPTESSWIAVPASAEAGGLQE